MYMYCLPWMIQMSKIYYESAFVPTILTHHPELAWEMFSVVIVWRSIQISSSYYAINWRINIMLDTNIYDTPGMIPLAAIVYFVPGFCVTPIESMIHWGLLRDIYKVSRTTMQKFSFDIHIFLIYTGLTRHSIAKSLFPLC